MVGGPPTARSRAVETGRAVWYAHSRPAQLPRRQKAVVLFVFGDHVMLLHITHCAFCNTGTLHYSNVTNTFFLRVHVLCMAGMAPCTTCAR